MTKKDFSGALRRTATVQRDLIDERFSRADSVLLGMQDQQATSDGAGSSGEVHRQEEARAPAATSAAASGMGGQGGLVVRDTFSMPRGDHDLIEVLRIRAAREGRNTGKSEIIRAGLAALAAQAPADLVALLDGLERVRPGRK